MKAYFCILIFSLTLIQSAQAAISDYERKILAAVLVLEASNQGKEGMKAVLNVIHNRAGHRLSRVVPVAVKKGQFSSINSVTGRRSPDYGPILRRAYRHHNYGDAIALVRKLETGRLKDNTFGATHYYSSHIKPPYWASYMQYLTTIGHHHFYTDANIRVQAQYP